MLGILLVAIFSGATASVVGFGIGSLLTPLLAGQFGTTVAVAAVTLPHALATALRCWRLRANIDRRVLVRFGLLSGTGASPTSFVATATATGLLVDLARTPIYLWKSGPALRSLWVPMTVAAVGVLIGTVLGERILLGLSARRFGQLLGIAIGLLGCWLITAAS